MAQEVMLAYSVMALVQTAMASLVMVRATVFMALPRITVYMERASSVYMAPVVLLQATAFAQMFRAIPPTVLMLIQQTHSAFMQLQVTAAPMPDILAVT